MDQYLKLIFNRRERKFPLAQDRWNGVAECVRRYLPTHKYDGVHSITGIRTTYLDTPRLDSYREYLESRPIRKKVRIRQYGYDGVFEERCWIEIKIKRYAETLKRRFCCSSGGVVALLAGKDILAEVLRINANRPDAAEIYQASRSMMAKRRLRPVVRVDYERLAFEEPASDSTRITIDRNVRFHTTRQSTSAGFGGIIMEVKCANGVPKWLADFRRDLALDGPSRFSKFARAVGELGTERLLRHQQG